MEIDAVLINREVPRIRKALERIADGIDRYVEADPLTVLHEAMRDDPRVSTEEMAQLLTDATSSEPAHPLMPAMEKKGPCASNGETILYYHPDPRFEVVLRRDRDAPSGYVATVESA